MNFFTPVCQKQKHYPKIVRGFLLCPEKSFVKTFKELAKGHGNVIDYGPRETDIYDWNNQKNYNSAIKEYNEWMQSIADRLNNAVGDMEIIFKVWGDISDKYRKKDAK